MSEFNILYWNTHYADGYKLNKTQILLSSKVIIEEISKIINEKGNIDAVIFTESYPQINDGNHNNIIKDYFDKELKFYTYPQFDIIEDYPYYINEKNKCTNGIFIATKEQFAIKNTLLAPNCMILKNEKMLLCGMRVFSTNDDKKYIEQFAEIRKLISDDENLIMIGDYNPGIREDENVTLLMKEAKFNGKLCSGKCECRVSSKPSHFEKDGENVNYIDLKSNNRGLVSNYTDKIYIQGKNIHSSGFKLVSTPEQIYCNNKYLDSDGHIKREFMYLSGKTEIEPIISKEYLYKDKYKGCDFNIKYNYASLCNTPFPDHNLLYASIDLGDD